MKKISLCYLRISTRETGNKEKPTGGATYLECDRVEGREHGGEVGEFTGELEARVDEDGFALAEREGFPGQRRVSSVIFKQNMQIKSGS